MSLKTGSLILLLFMCGSGKCAPGKPEDVQLESLPTAGSYRLVWAPPSDNPDESETVYELESKWSRDSSYRSFQSEEKNIEIGGQLTSKNFFVSQGYTLEVKVRAIVNSESSEWSPTYSVTRGVDEVPKLNDLYKSGDNTFESEPSDKSIKLFLPCDLFVETDDYPQVEFFQFIALDVDSPSKREEPFFYPSECDESVGGKRVKRSASFDDAMWSFEIEDLEADSEYEVNLTAFSRSDLNSEVNIGTFRTNAEAKGSGSSSGIGIGVAVVIVLILLALLLFFAARRLCGYDFKCCIVKRNEESETDESKNGNELPTRSNEGPSNSYVVPEETEYIKPWDTCSKCEKDVCLCEDKLSPSSVHSSLKEARTSYTEVTMNHYINHTDLDDVNTHHGHII